MGDILTASYRLLGGNLKTKEEYDMWFDTKEEAMENYNSLREHPHNWVAVYDFNNRIVL